jgi:hypothetical protein
MKFLSGLPCITCNYFTHTEREDREMIMKIHHELEKEPYYWDEKKGKVKQKNILIIHSPLKIFKHTFIVVCGSLIVKMKNTVFFFCV